MRRQHEVLLAGSAVPGNDRRQERGSASLPARTTAEYRAWNSRRPTAGLLGAVSRGGEWRSDEAEGGGGRNAREKWRELAGLVLDQADRRRVAVIKRHAMPMTRSVRPSQRARCAAGEWVRGQRTPAVSGVAAGAGQYKSRALH